MLATTITSPVVAWSVARNTALVIKLAPGVSLGELYGFPYRESNGSLMISLAEFSSEQSKNVLMKLNVPGDAEGERASKERAAGEGHGRPPS